MPCPFFTYASVQKGFSNRVKNQGGSLSKSFLAKLIKCY